MVPVIAVALIAFLDYGDYSHLWVDEEKGESLVEAWDGPAGAVAVVRHDNDSLRIRVNSSYNLGSSASAVTERLQGQVPLLLHPDPRSVFFLGLGTGITASGAMDFDVDRVVVADLFLSFKSGVGRLYTLEHFEAVRDHLEPGGIFVQWLPMFDLSEPEFDIVTRTMLEVFPSVTLWRRTHSPRYPVYALVGSLDDRPLDPISFERRLAILRDSGSLDPNTWILNIPYAAYVSNLRAIEDRFSEAPLNTDDRTLLEYVAPVTERNSRGAKSTETLAFEPLLEFCDDLLTELPPDRDPYLVNLADGPRNQVRASLAYYGYVLHSKLGNRALAQSYLRSYEMMLKGNSP